MAEGTGRLQVALVVLDLPNSEQCVVGVKCFVLHAGMQELQRQKHLNFAPFFAGAHMRRKRSQIVQGTCPKPESGGMLPMCTTSLPVVRKT
jgi:hypothetical protein